MASANHMAQIETPDFVTILAEKFPNNYFFQHLYFWQYLVYSLIVAALLSIFAYLATRKLQFIPGRLQNIVEIIVSSLDDFVCGMLGKQGRRFVPFIGTIFIYVLSMNLFGLIPFMKSATANLSTTFALSLCVFFYVQYAAVKQLGFVGYVDHLLGKPRGGLAFTVILPLFMLFMHIVSELIKPITLSLRLRSNILADDMLLGALSGFGIKGLPLLFFCMMLVIISAIIQAFVFSLLSTVYFAIFLTDENH